MFNILVTVIIPVYNQQASVKNCIKSLQKQTYGFKNIELILINDGSVDESARLCRKFLERYKNVRYIEQDNRGVSAARNAGLRIATGKYIFFLDADDTLASNTVADSVCLFEKIYDKTDLVTYPIETHYRGEILKPHFRYHYLRDNGVYDLRTNAFIGQTTMNIVVKNQYSRNILFDESLSFSEDQKYCCDVMKRTLTMGFCKTAKYIYNRNDESSSGKLAGSCFTFEPSLKMFEDLFGEYEHVPMAFQGLFVNDIYWRMVSNIYFPYHYDNVRYRDSIARIRRLLRKCYPSVILDHPAIDYYEKFFLMRLKGDNTIQTALSEKEICMYSEGYEVFKDRNLEMVVTRVKIVGHRIKILGFLKSVFFQFYRGSIELVAVENKTVHRELALSPSTHNYYLSHEPTQHFWRMEYECDAWNVHELSFEVVLNETTVLPVTYYFMPLTPFSKKYQYSHYEKDAVQVCFKENRWEFICRQNEQHKPCVWLYYDCRGVSRDNGLEQFLHDRDMADNIERYYVITDESQYQHIPKEEETVVFGTSKHKMLLLNAEKVITAYIENNNILPFAENDYEKYANQFRFETVYLQHGVLHIDMPWKYSPEKIIADKVVVSSETDAGLFLKNGFPNEDLWKVKMPRFDFLPLKAKGKNKILFAPSWRSYLVGDNKNNRWEILGRKMEESHYYTKIKEFLESERLIRLLERNDYILDVKWHPIFLENVGKSKADNERIALKNEVVKEEYNLFITDFSSFMFDFLYMEVPVLSFVPDFDEFACGMNGYRKVDFMDKVEPRDICKTVDEIIDRIEEYFQTGKGMQYQVKFYGAKNGKSRKSIYNMLIKRGGDDEKVS